MNDIMLEMLGGENDAVTKMVEQLRSDRKIVLNEEVGDWLIEKLCMQILVWNKEDETIVPEKRKKIVIFINSPGGDVVLGMHILDIIANSKTPIVTVGLSSCCSMASYLLAAGHERYCFPNTVVLMHDGQSGYSTTSRKGKDIQAFYDKLDERVTEFMISHTKLDHDYLESVADRELYVLGEEAKEMGIVDKIIGIDCSIYEVLG